MKFIDRLKYIFSNSVTPPDNIKIVGGRNSRTKLRAYSIEIFYQLFMIIADVFAEAEFTFTNQSRNRNLPKKYLEWFKNSSAKTMWDLLQYGYTAVAYSNDRFITINHKWLSLGQDGKVILPAAIIYKGVTYQIDPMFTYCMTTETFDIFQLSDFDLLEPFFRLIDSTFSNTQSAMEAGGKVLMISPAGGDAHTSAYLDPLQKKEWEESFNDDYVNSDKSIVSTFFSNIPALVNEIDLTALSQNTMLTVKDLILLLAGHLRIPANQIPIIDANTSHGFSNGGELLLGDTLKYKTVKRLMTYFVDIAAAFGMTATYILKNDPELRVDNTQINITENETVNDNDTSQRQ